MFEPFAVLLLLALVPRRAFGPLLDRWWLGILVILASAVLLGGAGIMFSIFLGMPAVALLLLFRFYGKAPRPWQRWGAFYGIALFWSLLMVPIRGEASLTDGHADVWLTDLFNRMYFRTTQPLLEQLGMSAVSGEVLGYLGGTLRFASDHLPGIFFIFAAGLAAVSYAVARTRDERLPPAPDLKKPLSPFLLLAVVSAQVFAMVVPPSALEPLLIQSLGAIYLIKGLSLLYLLAAGSLALRAIYWAVVLVIPLAPLILWIPILLAVADSFLSISSYVDRHTRHRVLMALRIQQAEAVICSTVRPVPVLAMILVVQVMGNSNFNGSPYVAPSLPPLGPALASTLPGTEAPATTPGDLVEVSHAGRSVRIDRYELPNQAGTYPRVGLTPDGARSTCEKRGRHLCTRAEWWWACSSGGKRRWMLTDDTSTDFAPGRGHGSEALHETCNLFPDTTTGTIALSGSHPGCRSDEEVVDLVGNVYEWVELDPERGLFGLAGADYRAADDISISCDHVAVIHRVQAPLLDLETVGARCCG